MVAGADATASAPLGAQSAGSGTTSEQSGERLQSAFSAASMQPPGISRLEPPAVWSWSYHVGLPNLAARKMSYLPGDKDSEKLPTSSVRNSAIGGESRSKGEEASPARRTCRMAEAQGFVLRPSASISGGGRAPPLYGFIQVTFPSTSTSFVDMFLQRSTLSVKCLAVASQSVLNQSSISSNLKAMITAISKRK